MDIHHYLQFFVISWVLFFYYIQPFLPEIPACRLDIQGNVLAAAQQIVPEAVAFTDIVSGKYSIVESHPEALLESQLGQKLLDDPTFIANVKALVIDECHKVDQW